MYERHGYKKHPIYNVWIEMRRRCYGKCSQHKDYSGRGIKVCDEWKNSAKVFIEWAIPLWKKGLVLDRRDNDGNYCPENCRFITMADSNRNRRLIDSTNKSGYRGVSFQDGKWRSQIQVDGCKKHLGMFDSPVIAALRYDAEVYKLNDERPANFL